jgi:hypothetical protein
MFKIGQVVERFDSLAIVVKIHDDWIRIKYLGLSPMGDLAFDYVPIDTLKPAYLGFKK